MSEYPERAATSGDPAPETRDVDQPEATAEGDREREEPDRPVATAAATGAGGPSTAAAATGTAEEDLSDRAARVARREKVKLVPTSSRPSSPPAPGRGLGRGRGVPAVGRRGMLPATAEVDTQSDDEGDTVPPDFRAVQDLITALQGVNLRGQPPAAQDYQQFVSVATLNKSPHPKWDRNSGERFYTFKQRVELWASSMDLQFLLHEAPDEYTASLSKAMKAIVVLQLPPADIALVASCRHMCDVWVSLCDHYMPARKTELQAMKMQFSTARCEDGDVPAHTTRVTMLVNELSVLGWVPPPEDVAERLTDVKGDSRYENTRFLLTEPEAIAKGPSYIRQQMNNLYFRLHPHTHTHRLCQLSDASQAAVSPEEGAAGTVSASANAMLKPLLRS